MSLPRFLHFNLFEYILYDFTDFPYGLADLNLPGVDPFIVELIKLK